MVIDFHTHVFSDKIAEKTIAALSKMADIPAHTDGTVTGLIAALQRGGADFAVTLPVLTRPEQFEGVNRFAKELNEKGLPILSFGGIHPACEDIEGKMRSLKEMGFRGVKIHPDYQMTYFDDPAYLKILSAARELDLIVVTHAGVDDGYRDQPVRCTPDRVRDALSQVSGVKLVLAHMGGNRLADEVEEKLLGLDLYLDTAYSMHGMEKEQFLRFVRKHGADKILFATDSPWRDIGEELAILRGMGLTAAEEEKILYRNAVKLLGIKE